MPVGVAADAVAGQVLPDKSPALGAGAPPSEWRRAEPGAGVGDEVPVGAETPGSGVLTHGNLVRREPHHASLPPLGDRVTRLFVSPQGFPDGLRQRGLNQADI